MESSLPPYHVEHKQYKENDYQENLKSKTIYEIWVHKYAKKLNQALINQVLTNPIETKRIEKMVGKERGYQGDGLTLSCI